MPSQNVSRYSALEDAFTGSTDPEIQEALKAFFWEKYRKREADYRRAAEALVRSEVGSPCSELEPACTGQPAAPREGATEYLKLTRFDGAMTFLDASNVFRFRVTVDYAVEQMDQTAVEAVAHVESHVRNDFTDSFTF